MRPAPHEWVLVTGGSGFVGGALVRRLLHLGYHVRVISRQPRATLQRRAADREAARGRLDWFQGDIRERDTIVRAFDGARYVYHAAGLVDSTAPPEEFERANVVATRHVCELARDAGVERLVHVGTSDVFGLPRPGETITERTPYRPWGEPYPDSKIASMAVVQEYRARGLETAVVHPGWVYGPGDRAFLPALVRQIRSGVMPLWAPTGARVHLVYIEDLVDALLAAGGSPAARGEEFLFLDDASEVDLDELCRRAAAYLKLRYRPLRLPYAAVYATAALAQRAARLGLLDRPPFTTNDVRSFGHRFHYSAAKAARLLRWSPRMPFDDGMEAALRWHVGWAGLVPGVRATTGWIGERRVTTVARPRAAVER